MTEVPEADDESTSNSTRRRRSNLLDEMGGPQGIADSSLPGLLVIAYTFAGRTSSLLPAIAVGLGALIGLSADQGGDRRDTPPSGFVGVALAGFIATRTGKAEDFFLPGLLFNAGYAIAYAVSIAVRWPLIGVFIGPLIGEGMNWRQDPDRVRLFSKISWLWVGIFVLRLAVQLPLYLSGSLVALGIAKTAMGLPIFALALWFTYLMLRAAASI